MTAPSDQTLSRRGFLRAGAAAGIAVKVSFLRSPSQASLAEGGPRPGPGWVAGTKPRYRLDALAKVTGAKTFTRGYRARDIPGWPDTQAHAFLIAATKADRRFEGLDLTRLGTALQPDRLVMHEDLVADGIAVPPHPDFFGDRFLVPRGATSPLLGQPVALLIYHDYPRYAATKRSLRFADDVVRYGAQTAYDPPPHYGATRRVRIEGETPEAEDRFSPLKDAPIFAGFAGDRPAWPAPGTEGPAARGMAAVDAIAAEIAAAGVERLDETFRENLAYAAAELRKAGIRLLIEPINTRDIPGFFLTATAQGVALIEAVGSDNLFVQYDAYHMQIMEGDLSRTIQQNLPHIAHVQIADNPGRHEPGTGEINYPFLFEHLDRIGYRGWIGCEYRPAARTEDGLSWFARYRG